MEAILSAGAAVVVGVLSLVGVVITNSRSNEKMQSNMRTAQAITEERLAELTREVREHNNFAQRVPVLEEQFKSANHRISDLEELHKKG